MIRFLKTITFVRVFHGFFISLILATSLSYAGTPIFSDGHENQRQQLSVPVPDGYQKTEGRDATELTKGVAASAAAGATETWLNQFGTARVNLRVDSRFSLQNSSFDFLLPLYDTPDDVVFTQLGAREHDDLFTTNVGLGHRHFFNQWMMGYNVFWDNSWRNVNRRYGLGLEIWRDNLRFSGNVYRGISGWHNSGQHEGYDERPADGWDIRTEGWLPAFPQLGGKIGYEQYYGDNVALFDNFSDRQKNPHVFTLGLNYTPVSLVTVGVDQKMGKGGMNDTQFTMQLTYRPGESWSKQISPDGVTGLRTLDNSRLELVNRNNNIVLDYRKQNRLQLSFPPQITGEEQSTVTFRPVVKASNGLDYIELNDTALIQAGGRVISVSNSAITIQLPEYQSQPVRLSGVAVDSKGNRSDVAETLIMTSQRMTSATITTDKTTAIANGTDAVTYTVTVKDDHNRPVADEVVTWTTNMGILGTPSAKMTDNNGQVTVTLTSTTAGNAVVSADAAGRHLTAPAVLFSDAASVSSLKLVVSSNNAEADSRSQNIVNVTVLDKSNKPLKGVQVDWVIAGHTSAAAVTPTKVMTDDNGNATLALTDSTAEIVQVSVSAGNLSAQTSVTFIVPKVASLSLSPADDWSQPPDEPLTVTATVLDKYGQPVKGVNVIWSLSNTQDFRAQSSLQSVSDENGHAVFEVVGSIMSSNTVITVVAGEKTAELYLVIGIG